MDPGHHPSRGQISLRRRAESVGGIEESLSRGSDQKWSEPGEPGGFGQKLEIVFPGFPEADSRIEQDPLP